MKIKNNFIIGSFLEKRAAVLAWGVLMALMLTAAGCQSREVEFLEAAARAEKAPGAPSDGNGQAENSSGSGGGAGKSAAGADEEVSSAAAAGADEEVSSAAAAGADEEVASAAATGADGEVSSAGAAGADGDASLAGAAGADSEAAGKPGGEDAAQPEKIFVDVCGAVKSPGVFELEDGSRVFQAVEAAGGLLPEAAGEYVNLAVRLNDGQQVYIPTREEAESTSDFKSPLEKSASGPGADPADGQTQGSGKINLNTADESALTTLTGIGASKAQAILAYREEHGGFSTIEDILNVPGIKEGTFMKIKDNIAVE